MWYDFAGSEYLDGHCKPTGKFGNCGFFCGVMEEVQLKHARWVYQHVLDSEYEKHHKNKTGRGKEEFSLPLSMLRMGCEEVDFRNKIEKSCRGAGSIIYFKLFPSVLARHCWAQLVRSFLKFEFSDSG